MLKSYVVLIILCALLTNLRAQISTDRPNQTESSLTLNTQELQIETGVLLSYQGAEIPSDRQILLPVTIFRLGLTDAVELRLVNQLEFNGRKGSARQGLSDLQIGTKIQLYRREDSNTDIAFLSHLLIPSGTSEVTQDGFGLLSRLLVSHQLNEKLNLAYNIGFNVISEDQRALIYTLALGVALNDRISLFAEPYGEIGNMEDYRLSFDTGFTYLASEDLQWDFALGTGVNHDMNFISVGISWLMDRD